MHRFLAILISLVLTASAFAQPANDDCANAREIPIANNGYGFGVFTSAIDDISSATIQSTETFAPAILVAGQNKKSIWYKFSLPTHRSVRVTLQQPGIAIAAGNVGFAVYKTDSCLPINNQLSSKLTPIATFGNTYHPCVEPGEYLVQVSSNVLANGPLSIRLQVSDSSGALYDHPSNAYQFNTLSAPTSGITYYVGCQSIEDSEENCPGLGTNYREFTKSTWHTFKTPAYFDYLSVLLASPTGVFPAGMNKFGYTLYEGDAKTDGTSSLTLIDGCDSLKTSGYTPAHRMYKCGDLKPNTVYSIQLFFPHNFYNDVRLAIAMGGTAPANGPEPIKGSIGTNELGTLPSSAGGITTNTFDYLACNTRINTHGCDASIPTPGVKHNNINYTLSTFFTFTLSTASNISVWGSNAQCGPNLFMRLYKQDLTASCTGLDTVNIISQFIYTADMDCLPAGTYTLQVLARDTAVPITNYYYGNLLGSSQLCMLNNLGQRANISIRVHRVNDLNKYSLKAPGAYDTVNVNGGSMLPFLPHINYQSKTDTFGCERTVLPAGQQCANNINKAMYRQFAVMDSGLVTISNLQSSLWYKMYSGDANALATSQGAHQHTDSITGLTPVTSCMDYYGGCTGDKVCIVPGTYTFATFANQTHVGWTDRPSFRFTNSIRTKFNTFAKAQDMGSILDTVDRYGGNQVASIIDTLSCYDNAVPINGYNPCSISGKPATKAIYRQFYLSSPSIVSINNGPIYCISGINTLFKGKITDGEAGLTPMPSPWNCFTSAQVPNACSPLPAGWYTVVSYGQGPSYENPLQNTSTGGNSYDVGQPNQIVIRVTKACPGPKYNRPYKAAIDTLTNEPFLIEWAPRATHTAAYPKTDTTYKFPTEHFNCTIDTPFTSHPIATCAPGMNRVVYYVFRTTQESYVNIDTKNYWGQVFAHDVRFDSLLNTTATPIQSCLKSEGYIQLCKLQPGTYTLVLFANDANSCSSVQPTIYIDRVGYSRFDHANNAYDFGVVPADSAFYNSKIGDVNPLDATRAPSNDFFYCTTGAQSNDPPESGCYAKYNAAIYNTGVNNALYTASNPPTSSYIARRNLWYTFVADKPGYIHVRVTNKTTGKQYQYPFAVYRSDANGSLPFNQLASSGQVDSTLAQGLTLVSHTTRNTYFCGGTDKIIFYRDPCTQVTPERYYIVVDNRNPIGYGGIHDMNPNSQLEVSILVDTIDLIRTKFDHYYQASNMGNLGIGSHVGETDNYSCATRDATDPINGIASCTKTIWYKFSTNITGHVRFRVMVNGSSFYNSDHVRLYREIIPGDSTFTGLSYINAGTVYDAPSNAYWNQNCVSPGTYYLLLPGCTRVNENVYPEIKIIEQAGDFCSAPVVSGLNGPGAAVSTVSIDCHTIGTDYGEFNPTLTCPANAERDKYKSSWFRIDITGNDTLDVTAFLAENTTANPADIQYRLMTGGCGAMQEQSCVQDAQTQNTYKCLAPGSYFIQVFTPVIKNGSPVTGTINLNLSAVVHADTCAPINDCFANANFVSQFNCNTSDSVSFLNFSTYGSAIKYEWDFGYNANKSNAVAPKFSYPALPTNQTYNVTLTVTNTQCGLTNNVTLPVTIPARPAVNLGKDTTLCAATSLLLDATSYPGATYLWQNNSTAATFNATQTGSRSYHVKVTYNGCSKADTIKVNINPISAKPLQQKMFCGNDSVQLTTHRGHGETYTWSTGATTSSIHATDSGYYWVDLSWNGCTTRDSFFVTRHMGSLPGDTSVCLTTPFLLNASAPGATGYTWQDNSTAATINITSSGTYSVRINFGACFVNDTINVSGLAPFTASIAHNICNGNPYMLPSGKMVTAAGTYNDTLRTQSGCDSLITTVQLTAYQAIYQNTNVAICPGATYMLPSGATVNAAGEYKDTIRYVAGCDSLITTANVAERTHTVIVSSASICSGASLTLPWGAVVSTAGSYSDTLRYEAGCDSVINTVVVTVMPVATEFKNVLLCSGETYTLPSGKIVNTEGIYRDTLPYLSGCDSLYITTSVSYKEVVKTISSASICSGETYILPAGGIVSLPGTYIDTLRYNSGCDSIITTTTLFVKMLQRETITTSICEGAVYTLPSGVNVNVAGTYIDTLRYQSGCDSTIITTVLNVQLVKRTNVTALVCAGENYTLPSGSIVTISGTYLDTLHYQTGCDSLITTTNLTVREVKLESLTASICEGASYTLPSGIVVSTAGLYTDTLHHASGCDSVITTTTLSVKAVQRKTVNASICEGAVYTSPSGVNISLAGTYIDTLHYQTGCDSVIITTVLNVQQVSRTTINASICSGETYNLPSGRIVTISGTYLDTLHYQTGCDSLITTTSLAVREVKLESLTASICEGASYTLPSGIVVSTAGLYTDTLHYASGCDSVITNTTLSVKAVEREIINITVCEGAVYTLPSGVNVNIAGTYIDTLRYQTGCDSVIINTVLNVQQVTRTTANASVCAGETYTLPSGAIVTISGTYLDTLHYQTGCDSLITTTNLTVRAVKLESLTTSICEGVSYTLPSGIVVSTAGLHTDTLHYASGCDSVITTTTLSVKAVQRETINITVCEGAVYTLPSGVNVNVAGTYIDTLRYQTGCDSLITTTVLHVQLVNRTNVTALVCAGENYTLPSGKIVTINGTYLDTLHYQTGCDSLITTTSLTVRAVKLESLTTSICEGASYTLPSGIVVSTAGVYTDTLHYTSGCDSVITATTLSVKVVQRETINASVCESAVYTLPSGVNVTIAGTYIDTLRYQTGCDSLITTTNLHVNTLTRSTASATICQGSSITLPSGIIVNTPGQYTDTLKYASGCDSVIWTVSIIAQQLQRQSATILICPGGSHQLPSGKIVHAAGFYNDTLRYLNGCDSIIFSFTVDERSVSIVTRQETICDGSSYTLPSGKTVSIGGIYKDTLRYNAGCDSIITTLQLVVRTPNRLSSTVRICEGELYVLPWDDVVTNSGIYSDTLKSSAGCDSIIRTVTVRVLAKPILHVSKSNDVNCQLGTTTLNAAGGSKYEWSPASSLMHANSHKPIATPTATTVYKVKATSGSGCTAEDSIEVKVTKGISDEGYQVPSAFTPNSDGKNDCFGVKHWGAVSKFNMMIYDRWGNIVFTTTDPARCWDGKYNGVPAATAAFVYQVSAETNCGPVFRKGTIVLIR